MSGGFETISVIGGGAWGTALAHAAASAGQQVIIWARDAATISAINDTHQNPKYLPEIPLHEEITATDDLDQAGRADLLILATPAQTTAQTAGALRDILADGTPVVISAKGMERAGNRLLDVVLADVLPQAVPAVLSGPSFAVDVASGLPTAVTIGCRDEAIAAAIAQAFAGPSFRPYISTDMIGIQVGGALKNVLAIAAGIVVGRRLGASAQAALIARGFRELSRLGVALGADRQTLSGLSGLGDLVLSCSNRQSRNFSFGIALGEGQALDRLVAPGEKLVEGAHTAGVAVTLAGQYGIDAPICAAVADIVEGGVDIDTVISRLMARPLKHEDI